MCESCGCSEDGHARITVFDPAGGAAPAAHGRHHGHGHGHGHHHDHDHPHAHGRGSREDLGGGGTVSLEADVLARNNLLAQRNRGWFEGRGILALNFVSSPGSGKTTLLERTIRAYTGRLPVAVIEGDQETTFDAERIRATGCRVAQINTGAGCHLDAHMVAHGLEELDPPPGSLVLIENVGNLVCPALFDLGEALKVAILSVTEGDDKPLKYPHMFRAAGLILLNKIDLLPHVDFSVERCVEHARRVNPRIECLPLSATRGDGMDDWFRRLDARLPTCPRNA